MTRDDDQRWSDARSLLDSAPTVSADQRLRRWRRRQWAFIASVVLLMLGVGALVAALLTGDASGDDGSGTSGLQQALGLMVMVAGLAMGVVGFVRLWRRGRLRAAWRQPALVLTRSQRRLLLAEVRGRVPADPAHLALARDLAQRLIDARQLFVLFSGIAVLQVGQAIGMPETWRVAMSAALLVVLGVAGVLMVRDARSARRFLDGHPEPCAGVDGSPHEAGRPGRQ